MSELLQRELDSACLTRAYAYALALEIKARVAGCCPACGWNIVVDLRSRGEMVLACNCREMAIEMKNLRDRERTGSRDPAP